MLGRGPLAARLQRPQAIPARRLRDRRASPAPRRREAEAGRPLRPGLLVIARSSQTTKQSLTPPPPITVEASCNPCRDVASAAPAASTEPPLAGGAICHPERSEGSTAPGHIGRYASWESPPSSTSNRRSL